MRRWFRYRAIVPIFRSPHSAAHTARGVANGVFWALTPTIGLQTFAILAAWFVGRTVFNRDSSLVQALLWVWINNPLTVLPMYYAFYVTGLWLIGDGAGAPGYEAFTQLVRDDGRGWSLRLGELASTVGGAMLVGCLPYAAAGSLLSYRWAISVVSRRRARLALRRANYETFRTSNTSP